MLRFAIAVALAFVVPSVCRAAESVSRQEQFLNGTDAQRHAMLKEVLGVVSKGGYRDVVMMPWYVVVAKNAKGSEVMLLVDPVTLMTLELETATEQSAASESALRR